MAAEIIIVDDDPIGGGLTNTLLRESGFTTMLIEDSRKAVEAIRQERPRLVILDILMPGIDGLTLCHMIKGDPATRQTKVVIVSGKSFQTEKDRASRYGAELFIEKPYSVDEFAQRIIQVAGPPAAPPPPGGVARAAVLTVKVRGMRAAAQGNPGLVSRFGLETPCVSVETASNIFVLDAGTGILPLGDEIVREGRYKDVWILLTHFHPAHVAGLGRFAPTRRQGFSLKIGGPSDPDKKLQEAVREAFQASFAAVKEPIVAPIQLYELQEGAYNLLPGLKLQTFYANHPSTTLGFVLECEGRRVIYCPDSEIYGEAASAMQDYDEKLGNLCHGADLLIHDARWSEGDYGARKNQGHSSVGGAVEFGVRNEVNRLVLFHADASYSDADLEASEGQARRSLQAKGSSMQVDFAREGVKIAL